MTDQEIFDKVATHLLTQNAKSVGAPGKCMYRAEDGKMCAVGVLIPDEAYDPCIENVPVAFCSTYNQEEKAAKLFAILKSQGLERKLSTLLRLQAVHDETNPEDWKSELAKFAAQRELNTDVLKAFNV